MLGVEFLQYGRGAREESDKMWAEMARKSWYLLYLADAFLQNTGGSRESVLKQTEGKTTLEFPLEWGPVTSEDPPAAVLVFRCAAIMKAVMSPDRPSDPLALAQRYQSVDAVLKAMMVQCEKRHNKAREEYIKSPSWLTRFNRETALTAIGVISFSQMLHVLYYEIPNVSLHFEDCGLESPMSGRTGMGDENYVEATKIIEAQPFEVPEMVHLRAIRTPSMTKVVGSGQSYVLALRSIFVEPTPTPRSSSTASPSLWMSSLDGRSYTDIDWPHVEHQIFAHYDRFPAVLQSPFLSCPNLGGAWGLLLGVASILSNSNVLALNTGEALNDWRVRALLDMLVTSEENLKVHGEVWPWPSYKAERAKVCREKLIDAIRNCSLVPW
ncbi:hypothetical protein BT69DRAFT_1279619 [Atractiella rhizophila]|nr:hypothetical protein BT69DRAFT_1279619 [Atractiella rhizophila]